MQYKYSEEANIELVLKVRDSLYRKNELQSMIVEFDNVGDIDMIQSQIVDLREKQKFNEQ